MTGERRYDDREVGQILKRVAELHERQGDKADARSMTRAELEQVVHELGISKALVARATRELAVQDVRNRPVWWLGGKTELMFEEVVDGHIDDATLTQMIEVLRRSLGDPGKLEQEIGARIWSTTASTSRRIYFTVVEHEDTTTLRLEERMSGDAGGLVVGTAFTGGFAGFMTVVPLKALVVKAVLLLMMGPLALSGALVGWFAGRAMWRRRSLGREEQLRRAFGEIVALAGARSKTLPASRGDRDVADAGDDDPAG